MAPTLRRLTRRTRTWRQRLSVARAEFYAETALCAAALTFLMTGGRALWLERLWPHADALAAVLCVVLFVLLHNFVTRRVVPLVARRYSPTPYDERRILFDLGQEARTARGIDELYGSVARRIAESLGADDVSIFVREESGGDYLCRISSRAAGEWAEPAREVKLARDAFVVKRLRSLSGPLVVESAEFDAWSRALAAAAPERRAARASEREALQRVGAHLLVQVRTRELMVGILSLGTRRGRFRYAAGDKEVLMSVAAQLALVIENSRLAERLVAEERLLRELALAAEVQRRLLPERPPESVAVELSGFCQPARGVGGDYYDFMSFDNRQLGIAIADVAGKGMAAALLMSTMQATLRSLSAGSNLLPQTSHTLADMVATLNGLLWNSTGGLNYVTFFYAQFDQHTRRLSYVNAGHNPPLLFRPGRSDGFRQLSSGGTVVGVFEHCAYEQETVEMRPGDLLLAYTDGLSEALSAGGEEFGEARIREALAETAGLSVDEIRDELVRRVVKWSAGTPQYDDLTFVVMKVR
ncbi:MAG: SpoIIE family protein phosphatase [Acidobacteria bacterium]|nr:SpoIIE family protein phosphatase [Acidobacteriota bacterium]